MKHKDGLDIAALLLLLLVVIASMATISNSSRAAISNPSLCFIVHSPVQENNYTSSRIGRIMGLRLVRR